MTRVNRIFITALPFIFISCAYLQGENETAQMREATRKVSNYEGTDAFEYFLQGTSIQNKIREFIEQNKCELGLVKTCKGALSALQLKQIREHLAELEKWRQLVYEKFIPQMDVIGSNPLEVRVGEKFELKRVEVRANYGGEMSPPLPKTLITFNLQDPLSKKFLFDYKNTLAISLSLYDFFFEILPLLEKSPKMQQIIEYDIEENKHQISKTFTIATDRVNWYKVVQGVNLFQEEMRARRKANLLDFHEEEKRVADYIQTSKTASQVSEKAFVNLMINTTKLTNTVIGMGRQKTLSSLANEGSKNFGNLAGIFQSRKGKLYNYPQIEELKSRMRPLDVLLEKTPFRLTDKFIPGYFGHVAVWLGSPDQWKNLTFVNDKGNRVPLADHPLAKKYAKDLAEGKFVVEALRPGVMLNTLEHFFDIDDFLVVRRTSLSEAQMADFIIRALQQIGKAYDFNFDVETESKIVCSEIAYTIFYDMLWPTSSTMGRFTISPDQVAWKVFDNCFDPVILFVDGKEISGNLKDELYKKMTEPGGIDFKVTGKCLRK